MDNSAIGDLLYAFANYYYSIPLSYVREKILIWHPETSPEQLSEVINECNDDVFKYHCCLETEGFSEPELVAEHVICFDDELEQFLEIRRDDLPFKEASENELLAIKDYPGLVRTPELDVLIKFAHEVLHLDDEWTEQLVHDCYFSQIDALKDGESWLLTLMKLSVYTRIRFDNLTQIRMLRRRGNAFYLTQPNPVLKGWRACDIPDAPHLPDDLPNDLFFQNYINEVQKAEEMQDSLRGIGKHFDEDEVDEDEYWLPPQHTVGRNDLCPCGSGKKYKKCCGAIKN